MKCLTTAFAALVGLTAAACEHAPETAAPTGPAIAANGDDSETPHALRPTYEVRLLGDMPGPVRDLLQRSSLLISMQSRLPAPTAARLDARIASDLERFRKVFRAEGFYNAALKSRTVRDSGQTRVEIVVTIGPRYTIAKTEVTYADGGDTEALPRTLESLGLKRGNPARSNDVAAASQGLIRHLQDSGRPFAVLRDRSVVVDHRTRTMSVAIVVSQGVAATLGEARVVGVTTIDSDYLQRFVPWRRGDRYDRRKLLELATRLRATGLFQSVQVAPVSAPSTGRRLDIDVTLKERPHRSVGFATEYATDLGLSGTVFWEHRNVLGRAEHLRLSATAARTGQTAGAVIRLPHFHRLERDVISETRWAHQFTDAYDTTTLQETLRVEQRLGPLWRVGAGGAVNISEIEEAGATRRFTILGLPMFAARDTRDNPHNPGRGARLRFDVTPYRTFHDAEIAFVRTEALATRYVRLDKAARFVAAGLIRLGSITGANPADIPATHRFYAGGGGSVRGFEYQKAGRLDALGRPVGGSSLTEAGLELRTRLFGDFGMVAFVDAGNVYETDLPGFRDPPLRVGAGVGLRYLTAVGPLRLDVAAPVNGREGIDPRYQVYVSFGQAF